MQHFENLVITVSPARTEFAGKGKCRKLVGNDYISFASVTKTIAPPSQPLVVKVKLPSSKYLYDAVKTKLAVGQPYYS